MKARHRLREFYRSHVIQKAITKYRLRGEYFPLIVGAKRIGLGISGWHRKKYFRYQVLHYDINNPGMYFYNAVGMPVPNRFITKRVTVGGFDRLIGYLKLHVDPSERYVPQEEAEAEDEDEDE